MRLRTTAPPKAFLMLKPKRLAGCPLARTKTVKWELERRLPARYTSSNSLFRTSRALRGNLRLVAGPMPLLGREPTTALLAARRQHLAAAFAFHAHAKPVCLGAAPSPRLKCTLWQSNPLSIYETCRELVSRSSRNQFEIRARKTSSLQREGGPFPAFARRFPAPAALALGSSLVQPDCSCPGSIRNHLVYLNSPQNTRRRRFEKALGFWPWGRVIPARMKGCG